MSTRRTKAKPKASGTQGNVATSALFERSLQHRITGGSRLPGLRCEPSNRTFDTGETSSLSLWKERRFFFYPFARPKDNAERVTYTVCQKVPEVRQNYAGATKQADISLFYVAAIGTSLISISLPRCDTEACSAFFSLRGTFLCIVFCCLQYTTRKQALGEHRRPPCRSLPQIL